MDAQHSCPNMDLRSLVIGQSCGARPHSCEFKELAFYIFFHQRKYLEINNQQVHVVVDFRIQQHRSGWFFQSLYRDVYFIYMAFNQSIQGAYISLQHFWQ
jgi:hypothetical protein